MSQHGTLICKNCRQWVDLGKAVYAKSGKVSYFYVGKEYVPETYQVLERVIMKFFAEHLNHELSVVLDAELDPLLTDEWQGIDGVGGISAEEYLSGWNGWPPPNSPKRVKKWRWWS